MLLFEVGKVYRLVSEEVFNKLVLSFDGSKKSRKLKNYGIEKNQELCGIDVMGEGDLFSFFELDGEGIWYKKTGRECWVGTFNGFWLTKDNKFSVSSEDLSYLRGYEEFMVLGEPDVSSLKEDVVLLSEQGIPQKGYDTVLERSRYWKVLTTSRDGCKMGWLYLLSDGEEFPICSRYPVSQNGSKYFIYEMVPSGGDVNVIV